ncbi:TPA: helix-turn-helix transcriptional regulator [Salmonella enterica]|uniref:Helix-turn-helix transcriptional regulator n=1 Tax=Salmonella enterica TaxID=28901 RepID=A0A743U295_SALER|nr:helix-turn-helix transcriptional regulator [Salmonella enterica]HAF2210431.1 helix-turn-helix transcriptional regulator [Salmonella enterica]
MIGLRIKEERVRLNLSQQKLADYIDVSKRTLIDWEKDRTSPTAVQLSALSSIGMDIMYIVTGSRLSNKESPYGTVNNADEAEMLAEYREGDEAARDAARYTLTRVSGKKRETS